jgi:hypothetical protein
MKLKKNRSRDIVIINGTYGLVLYSNEKESKKAMDILEIYMHLILKNLVIRKHNNRY